MTNFISVIIAFITALFSVISGGELADEIKNKGDISGFSQTVSVQKELPDFQVDSNGNFTVLQFSDTHMTTGVSFSDLSILKKMETLTQRYSPDLVVVSGDMVNDGDSGSFNKANVLRSVANVFEDLDQYWAYVPGNNDGMNYGTSEDVVAYLSQYEHCLVSDEPEISGACQYSLDLYDGEEMTHSLLFIDTMDYDSEDPNHHYGYVHADQVDWCKREIESKQAVNQAVYVSVFMHENTPNFNRAANDGKAYKTGYPTVMARPEVWNIPKNQPLDDVFEQSGCVGLLSMGHNHPLTVQCSFYKGAYYHITPKTEVASTLITIHTRSDDTVNMYDFKSVNA